MTGKITCLKRAVPGETPKKGSGTGFGFIEESSTHIAYFFHKNRVAGNFDSLTEGQTVEFDNEPSERGPRACNVRAL